MIIASVPGHPEIFVIGDAALFEGEDGNLFLASLQPRCSRGVMLPRRSRFDCKAGRIGRLNISTRAAWL